MKTSRRVTYALQAILLLAKLGDRSPVPCSTIAKQGEMPERFLLQILRKLVNEGILRSVRGVEGGYQLARDTHLITMADIFEAMGNTFIPSVPTLGTIPDACRRQVIETFSRAAGLARTELSRLTIAKLLELGGDWDETEIEPVRTTDSDRSR